MKESLLFGFIIGFFSASPLGPIGLLCMRRVISQGFTSGIVSAFGIMAFGMIILLYAVMNFS